MLTNGKFQFFGFRLCSRSAPQRREELRQWLRVPERHPFRSVTLRPGRWAALGLACERVWCAPELVDSVKVSVIQSQNCWSLWLFTHAGNDVIFDSTHTHSSCLGWCRSSSTAAQLIHLPASPNLLTAAGWVTERCSQPKAHPSHSSPCSQHQHIAVAYALNGERCADCVCTTFEMENLICIFGFRSPSGHHHSQPLR